MQETTSKVPEEHAKRRYRHHGSGSIRYLGKGRYRIGYDMAPPGSPRKQRFEVVKATKSQAEDLLRKRVGQARRGEFSEDDGALTFAEIVDRFLAAKALSREGTTVALYRRTLETHVLPIFGKMRVRDIRAQDVQRLLSGAKNQSLRKDRGLPLSAGSIRNLRTYISIALGYAVRQGFATRNVVSQVEPAAPAHIERVEVTKAVVSALLGAVTGSEIAAVVHFALASGCRRGEMAALRWGDVNLETGTYTIRRAAKNLGKKVVIGAPKTPRSRRTDILPAFGLRLLKAHRAEQAARHLRIGIGNCRNGPDGLVFDRTDGREWDPNELSRQFSRMRRRAKLPDGLRLHDLRHGYATLTSEAGVELQTISKSLGHASLAITSGIYVHLGDRAMQEKADKLDSYLGETFRQGAASES